MKELTDRSVIFVIYTAGTVQEQNRTNQMMGYTLLSSGDYFIVREL